MVLWLQLAWATPLLVLPQVSTQSAWHSVHQYDPSGLLSAALHLADLLGADKTLCLQDALLAAHNDQITAAAIQYCRQVTADTAVL